MALEGTLKDFALPDILQLIGIQRKTGLLTMENEQDTVTVQFFQGQVVGADTRLRKLEDLLGSVLVRTGRISEQQLQEVLAVQRRTLQRLGYILVHSGYLSEDELREALRTQISQIVYRLFRWRDARYNFAPMEHLEYDRDLTIPVSAETVLMEAARMIDEWPMIERRIRGPRSVFRRTPAGQALVAPPVPRVASDADFDLDLDLDLDGAKPPPAGGAPPGPQERDLLALVDGQAAVQDVVDRSPLGEFDVYRMLYDLVNRGLIEEVAPATVVQESRPGPASKLPARMISFAIFVGGLLGIATVGVNRFAPWKLEGARGEADALRAYASRGRLERIEGAVQMFYLDTGAVPAGLDVLAKQGFLRASDLLDPWGRAYLYEPQDDGYRLAGRDAGGEPADSLTLSHRFSAAQRLILEGSADPRDPVSSSP